MDTYKKVVRTLSNSEIMILEEKLLDVIYDNCMSDRDSLVSLIESYMSFLSMQETVEELSVDSETVKELLGFDPFKKGK